MVKTGISYYSFRIRKTVRDPFWRVGIGAKRNLLSPQFPVAADDVLIWIWHDAAVFVSRGVHLKTNPPVDDDLEYFVDQFRVHPVGIKTAA